MSNIKEHRFSGFNGTFKLSIQSSIQQCTIFQLDSQPTFAWIELADFQLLCVYMVTDAEKILFAIVLLAWEGGMTNRIGQSLTFIDIDWHSWNSCFTGGQGYMPKGRKLAPHFLSRAVGFLSLPVFNPVGYWLVICNWVIKWGQVHGAKLVYFQKPHSQFSGASGKATGQLRRGKRGRFNP